MSAEIIPFSFEGNEIRVVDVDDEKWFVASDVCKALAISNPSNALEKLESDERRIDTIYTNAGTRQMLLVSEPGLYELTLLSRKPEARRFKRWVKREVLPSIRKTGSYSIVPQQQPEAIEWAKRLFENQHALMAQTHRRVDSIEGDLAVQMCRTNEIDAKVEALKSTTDRLQSKIYTLESTTPKKRTEISKRTQDQLVYDLWRMGGRCPCCGVVELVDKNGQKTAQCEFDHFESNQRSSADCCWPICKKCHSDLTNQKTHRTIGAGAHFAAFQQKRKKLNPGLF